MRFADPFPLAGQRALITSAAQGIGLTIAHGLADAGAKLLLNDLDAASLAATADELRAAGRRVTTAAFNVACESEITAGVAGLARMGGPVDILVNNAGIQANGLGPGYLLTDMTRTLAADPVSDAWIRGRTPAGRWGKPRDSIGAAMFLASAASDFVNGQVLYVDGGLLAAL